MKNTKDDNAEAVRSSDWLARIQELTDAIAPLATERAQLQQKVLESKSPFDHFAEWRKFADDCDRAAGEAERMASETDCPLEKARWRGHADNFASAAKRTRDILSNV